MRELHGVHQFWWAFWRALWRHRKRGNVAITPLGVVQSWRCGQCARYIVTGRHPPRFIRKALQRI